MELLLFIDQKLVRRPVLGANISHNVNSLQDFSQKLTSLQISKNRWVNAKIMCVLVIGKIHFSMVH